MSEPICSQGHVIDNGRSLCQRCNSPAIGTVDAAPIPVPEAVEENTVKAPEELTKRELFAELAKLGIEFKESESKAELIEKLKNAAEESAEDVADEDSDEDSEEESTEESEDEEELG